MTINYNLIQVKNRIPADVKLVAVSKTKPIEEILEVYQSGVHDFAENKVQELIGKYEILPKDIRWHFIGHLQTNKVKYIAPIIHLIQSVDSLKLLKEINKEAIKCKRIIDCLLQVHIAREETKFGFSEQELLDTLHSKEFTDLRNIRICGLMGMATYTSDIEIIKNEFQLLKTLFDQIKISTVNCAFDFKELSIGMSSDFEIAISCGSTMIRVGSLIFGERFYKNI